MMRMTEIIQTAHDIHTGFQGMDIASQGASSPGQTIETLAKGGVEPFNESGVDHTLSLGLADQALHHVSGRPEQCVVSR